MNILGWIVLIIVTKLVMGRIALESNTINLKVSFLTGMGKHRGVWDSVSVWKLRVLGAELPVLGMASSCKGRNPSGSSP